VIRRVGVEEERFFSEPRIFFVDDDSGLSAIGQTASGLNFYDDSGRSPLAKHFGKFLTFTKLLSPSLPKLVWTDRTVDSGHRL
jgi:hypothetical protein